MSLDIDDEDVAYAEALTSTVQRLRDGRGRDGEEDRQLERDRDALLKQLGWISEEKAGSMFTAEEVRDIATRRFLTPTWAFPEPDLGILQL